eukprot:30918-Pelagococcus_subviridis.AAC.26
MRSRFALVLRSTIACSFPPAIFTTCEPSGNSRTCGRMNRWRCDGAASSLFWSTSASSRSPPATAKFAASTRSSPSNMFRYPPVLAAKLPGLFGASAVSALFCFATSPNFLNFAAACTDFRFIFSVSSTFAPVNVAAAPFFNADFTLSLSTSRTKSRSASGSPYAPAPFLFRNCGRCNFS